MNQHPDDRPAPAEQQPLRARVPDHVSGGAFSTGVIVMTAQAEFILDFVQNLGRPHQIVARVVMPHNVLPQLVDALQRNIDLYKGRWGELPATSAPGTGGEAKPAQDQSGEAGSAWGDVQYAGLTDSGQPKGAEDKPSSGGQAGGNGGSGGNGQGNSGQGSDSQSSETQGNAADASAGETGDASVSPQGSAPLGSGTRQATAQEVYDDLKIKDELLSGAYANAVMIGHGPHEFSFDFITNFYPHSAVSSRVFLAAGQVPRLYDSLKGTWDQLRSRMRPPGDPPEETPPSAEY